MAPALSRHCDTLSARLTEYQDNSGLAARERLLEAILVAYNLFIWECRLRPAQDDLGRGAYHG
jgi:hypothetical protein